MKSRQPFFSTLLVATLLSGFACAETDSKTISFTLQVAAFPEAEDERGEAFINQLAEAGEQPIWGIVEIPGRGNWMRVYIGSFKSQTEARQYGDKLVERHLIKEFLIKKASEIKSLSRPRSVIRRDPVQSKARPPSVDRPPEPPDPAMQSPYAPAQHLTRPAPKPISSVNQSMSNSQPAYALLRLATLRSLHLSSMPFALSQPLLKTQIINLAPALNPDAMAHADAIAVAIKLITGNSRCASSAFPGGLWISGDTREAMARLQWIAGKDAEVLTLDADNRVLLNWQRLKRIAQIDERLAAAPLLLLDYILANEGLRLLAQVIEGESRYLFHMGATAPTLGGEINVAGSLNLDNNFDSRINPYRRAGRKLDIERPPAGFDCLIALNPVARWFNLHSHELVQVGNITFHELSEAHAKVESGYEYLPKYNNPGAHNTAIAREIKLKEQRAEVVLTVGSNRVLKSEEEL